MRQSATSTSGTRASTSRRSSRGAAEVGTKKQLKRAEKNIAKARSKDSLRAFGKLTEAVDGELRIRNDPPVIVPIHELFDAEQHRALDEALQTLIRSYRATLPDDRRHLLERFRYVDAARKVVGVGSVGTRAWIVLLLGRDNADPLFLQFKEAEASVLEPFLGASEYEQHGQRVVEGQRLMQAASDIMLGWVRTERRRRRRARLLRAPALGREGLGAGRAMNPTALAYYARRLRPDPGSRPRPRRRQRRDRRLPRPRRPLRPGPGRVRGGLRRPERDVTTRRSSQPSSRAGSRPRPSVDR